MGQDVVWALALIMAQLLCYCSARFLSGDMFTFLAGADTPVNCQAIPTLCLACRSGKSTVASMLMGLYPPAQGEILVDGVPLQELDMQVRSVAWIGSQQWVG